MTSRIASWRASASVAASVAVLALLSTASLAAHAAKEFLSPEEAFKPKVEVAGDKGLSLHIDIAKGYHLYRERMSLSLAPEAAVLDEVTLPPGKKEFDENFNKEVETYADSVHVPLVLSQLPAGATQDLILTLASQGCADAGLCYPPQEQRWKLHAEGGVLRTAVAMKADEPGLPVAGAPASDTASASAGGASADAAATTSTVAATASTATTSAKDGDSISKALNSGSLWQVVGVFALAGLLLSFTPCVLPMVPILSSIIAGQGGEVSRSKGFLLSVAYALGMALVYTAFGVAAGLAGEGLAAALQKPAVLFAFAALLVALSMSMFGLYELQMPSSLQTRLNMASNNLQGGRYAGVFLMGGLSALVVGPCVAAPLAGALVFISQTKNVVIGGVALFSLACGMSVPLLLVGLSAGTLLPRTGAWMENVKRFFGFALIALAIWMVSPVLSAWLLMLAFGVWLLVFASWMGAFSRLPEHAHMWPRVRTGLAIALALAGAAQIVGVLSGNRDPLAPLHGAGSVGAVGAANAATTHPTFRRVSTMAELDAALQQSTGPTLLDFYADWCVACKEMERLTFPDPAVAAEMRKFQLLQVDVTANSAEDRAILKRFGLFGPPGILFFKAGGAERTDARVIGEEGPEAFVKSLRKAQG